VAEHKKIFTNWPKSGRNDKTANSVIKRVQYGKMNKKTGGHRINGAARSLWPIPGLIINIYLFCVCFLCLFFVFVYSVYLFIFCLFVQYINII
jgi:ABC-type multidrug transport system permease subunit